ncbi:MAG: diaminopimelate epimerase [Trueperaceae bacterium]
MRFHKYQALGNDYLVLEAGGAEWTPALVRAVCDRHLGIGADGVLVEDVAPDGSLALRIFNPDGSEAEKSGNGLRIFARYLWDQGRVGGEPFALVTRGGVVRCQVRGAGRMVFVELGVASFDAAVIPVAGPRREVVDEEIEAGGERLRFTAVTVGNPHCVVFVDAPTPELARRLGPALQTHPLFPRRTNVQFARVVDRGRIEMQIWERGAGYTLASGSSACAAAAASVRLGLCDGDVTVAMPGGELEVGVGAHFALTMLGPVRKVAEGIVAEELLSEAGWRAGAVEAQPPPTAAVEPAAARGATAAIEYRIDQPISAAQFVSVLRRSTLGERRPIDDAACIAGMLEHANLTITAWDGHDLVGVARSVTDFHYICYLSDVAVDIRYQGAGIGRELVRRTQGELGPRCTLRLVSAPAAMGFYPKLGFVPNERSWDLPPDQVPGSGA